MAHRICSFADLLPGTARRFEVEGQGVAIVRIGDDLHAIGDRCSHANFSLSQGEVDSDACTIECWKHGAAFSLTTGEPQTLPATKAVPVHGIEVSDGEVYVTLENARRGDGGRKNEVAR